MTKVIKAPSGEYYYCSPLVEHGRAEFYLYRNHAENSLGLFRVSMKHDAYIVPISYRDILEQLQKSARDLDPVGMAGYANLFPKFMNTWSDDDKFVMQLSIAGTNLGDDRVYPIEQIAKNNRLTLRDSAKLLLKTACLMRIYENAGYYNLLDRFSYGWLLNCTTGQAVFYHCDGVSGYSTGPARGRRIDPLYGIFHSKYRENFSNIARHHLQLVGYDCENDQYPYGVLPEGGADYLKLLKGLYRNPPSSIEDFLAVIVQNLDKVCITRNLNTVWTSDSGSIQLLPR